MVPKPSSPRLSTYRPVSSSSGHSIRAAISDTKFPLVPRSRRRRRPRSSSTSNGNDISFSSTHDSDDEDPDLRLSEHQVNSSPEPHQPQPLLPLRVPLMRLSDPAPILQDSRVFHTLSPSEDEPLLTYSSLPPTPIPSSPPPSTSNVERYRLPQKQSDVYTPPFSLWDYLREELLATDFDSHQELKWERVSNFLSIPVAIEKVSIFGASPSQSIYLTFPKDRIIWVHTLLRLVPVHIHDTAYTFHPGSLATLYQHHHQFQGASTTLPESRYPEDTFTHHININTHSTHGCK